MIINRGTDFPKSDFKFFLYRHIRLDKNQPFYIGVGTISDWGTYTRAFSQQRNKMWHGINSRTEVRVDIMYESDDYDDVMSKETEFVNLYGRLDLGTGILANLTDGGKGVVKIKRSAETRRLIAENTRRQPHGEQNRINISLAQKRRFQIAGGSFKSVKVYQYDLLGNYLSQGTTVYFSKLLDTTTSVIAFASRTDKQSKGFFWKREYLGEKIEVGKYRINSKIQQFDLDGNLIAVFNTITNASMSLAGTRGIIDYIRQVCLGKMDSYRGFKFKYDDK